MMHSIRTKSVLVAVMIAVITSVASLPAAILYFERRLDGLEPETRSAVDQAIELNAAPDFDGLGELLIAMAATAAVGVAAGVLLTRRHIRTIRRVSDAAVLLRTGDLTARTSLEPRRWHDEADDLATAFDGMAADIERLELARVTTSASIAHELRTPIAVLRARLQAQIDGLVDGSRDELVLLLGQTVLLDRLVEDLRVLGLHTAGRLELRRAPTDLADLVERTARSMSTADRPILTDLTSVVVDVDPDRMQQILINLITNARRHGPQNATITISLHCDAEAVSIRVIEASPDRHLPSNSPGTGLGLSIVETLVSAHGGTFQLEPNHTNGTTATIQLAAG